MTKRVAVAWGPALLGVLACLPTSGCAGSGSGLATLQATRPEVYRLGAGDELRVNVPGLEAMNNTYRVDDSGTIAVPMIDPIKVADLSIREAEAAISGGILQRRLLLKPQVSAQVVTYRPFYIAGEVQKPGQYAYVPGMSLMTAVSIAGGYTFRADTKNAMLVRGGGKGKVGADAPILPGDQIVIRESWF